MKHPCAWGSPPPEVSRRQWMRTLVGTTVAVGLVSPACAAQAKPQQKHGLFVLLDGAMIHF